MTARLIWTDHSVKVWELNGSGDEARIEAMLELYARSFPQYAHYVPRMRQRAKFGEEHRLGHIVHYWLVEVDNQPAGLRTFRYIRSRNCGIAIALAVDPTFREVLVNGHRLSMFLVHACLDQVIADAEQLGDPPVLGMVSEVEFPRLMEHYQRNGITKLPIQYLEPIFPPRSKDNELAFADAPAPIQFMPTSLGFLPNPKLDGHVYDIKNVADFALAFLVDHYGLPVDHPQVQAVLNSIQVIS
jgi:hypothetical protein